MATFTHLPIDFFPSFRPQSSPGELRASSLSDRAPSGPPLEAESELMRVGFDGAQVAAPLRAEATSERAQMQSSFISHQQALSIIITHLPAGFLLEPDEVLGIVQIESGFNPRAERFESRLGESSYGLMQLLWSTAKSLGFCGTSEQLMDPNINIGLGLKFLGQNLAELGHLLRRPGTKPELVASYNAGVMGVVRGNHDLSYIARWEQAVKLLSASGLK